MVVATRKKISSRKAISAIEPALISCIFLYLLPLLFTPLFESSRFRLLRPSGKRRRKQRTSRECSFPVITSFTVAEETIGLEIDDVHRVAGSVEVRYADDDDYQRQREYGSLMPAGF